MPNQIYRGNSEQKLYYLLNNFVGGMNTVDVDEVMSPNEFRELKNVDLSKQGMLQNRKGFKNLTVINKLLLENFDAWSLLAHPVLHISVLEDNIGLLELASEFDSLDEFKSIHANTYYYFHLLVATAYTRPARVEFNVLKFENDGDNWKHYVDFKHLATIYGIPKDVDRPTLTGIKSASIGNLTYYSLNDFVEDVTGLLEIKKPSEIFLGENFAEVRIINNNQNFYETTPYDIESEGYNLLASNPILNVSNAGALQSIRGVTLVSVEGENYYPLENIPTSGQFTALVMHTGTIDSTNLMIEMYYYNPIGEKITLSRETDYVVRLNDTIDDGILVYDFDLAKMEKIISALHIKFAIVDVTDIKIARTFETESQLVDYYNFQIDTLDINNDPVDIFYDTFRTNNFKPYKLYIKDSNYKYSLLGDLYEIKKPPANLGEFTYWKTTENNKTVVKKYYGTMFVQYLHVDWQGVLIGFPKYYQRIGTSWVEKTLQEYEAGTFKLIVYAESGILANDYTPPANYPNTLTGVEDYVSNLTGIYDINSRYPQDIIGVLKITDPVESLVFYNELTTGTIADFNIYSQTDFNLSEFTLVSQFGTNNKEPLKSLDLTGIKLTQINERLVIYKGNTLWFSVYGNPNYFPFRNYVTLPLIGDDEIVSINYFRGSHIVFTKERIYRISGYYPDITITMINDSIGCIAPNSIKSFNNTLVFLTYDGLYRLKQNYYMDGLENVEKVDNKVNGLYTKDKDVESILYNEQYLLYFKYNEDFDVLKYYYNINLPADRHPFTIDKYAMYPDKLFKAGASLISLKFGELYIYDKGYTDFLRDRVVYNENEIEESTYNVVVKTGNMMFGYPTHDKKFKSLFVKTHTLESIPISITTYVNDLLDLDPHDYYTSLNVVGEIEYNVDNVPNIETTTDNNKLGSFELGLGKLGKLEMNVHKLPLSSKGKYIQFILEQKLPSYFAIQDIGIVYKVNKIRAYQ